MGTPIATHLPCNVCGSSDAMADYGEEGTYCHSCRAWGPPLDGSNERKRRSMDHSNDNFLNGSYSDIPKRGLREDTCRKYGYQIGDGCQIANYRDTNHTLVAQKIRKPGKDFSITGNGKDMRLYGQQLFGTGKSVVITEGELDCLSVAQAFDCKWPVVSLPNGAPAAVKAIKRAYEWLQGFEKIVLCFDNDEPGQLATLEVAELLPPGKVFIMSLDRKDANEVLIKDGTAPLVKAYWNAKPWRPDGIVAGEDISTERLMRATARGYSLPYPKLDNMLRGLREGELVVLCAGSGIGKSTMAREITYHLHEIHGLTMGCIYLEESIDKTAQGFVAIDNNVPLWKLREDPTVITEEQWAQSVTKVVNTRMHFFDHFGSLDSERLLSKIRYMRVVLGCHFIILDHLSIVISGQDSKENNERVRIDSLMTNLRSLIAETGVGILAVSHLSKPDGKSHEEGGRVSLNELRGSGSIKQLSDVCVGLERDQQDEEAANECVVRVLKSREVGDLGVADTLEYNKATGRLLTQINPLEEEMQTNC